MRSCIQIGISEKRQSFRGWLVDYLCQDLCAHRPQLLLFIWSTAQTRVTDWVMFYVSAIRKESSATLFCDTLAVMIAIHSSGREVANPVISA
jgi:hypothetical protein